MTQQTPLFEQHQQCGARMVDFHGWMMPLHYGSQLDEHHAVRTDAGMFDVSHMTIVDLHGSRTQEFLRYLVANDVAKLTQPGKALYTAMLNASGGVIDDLIIYFLGTDDFRLVVNSATRQKDLAWINQQAEPFAVSVTVRDDLSLIAVQGPNAKAKVATLLNDEQRQAIAGMKPFFGVQAGELFIATTGYTGEEGYEIALANELAVDFWQRLLAAGVKPCGLGARDTLRLEAGMNLYGQEMDEETSPLIANMAWTVAWEPEDRDFIGREALEAQRTQVDQKLVGLILEDKGERLVFPLMGRYARSFAAHRLALVGDAAHTIHPLAGQGVNLGFMDAAELVSELRRLHREGKDIGQHLYLRRYERSRKHSAAVMLASMQGFRELFAGNNPAKKLLRDIGLKLADTLPGVKPKLIRQAMGLDDLPDWLR